MTNTILFLLKFLFIPYLYDMFHPTIRAIIEIFGQNLSYE